MKRWLAPLALLCAFLVPVAASAQWQVPSDTIPRGRGAGVTGFATSGVQIDGSSNLSPVVSNVGALGTATKMWADLFLASGAVINWNNGDIAITGVPNQLQFEGALNGYLFDSAVAPTVNGAAALGSTTLAWSTIYLASGGSINWNNGQQKLTQDNANNRLILDSSTTITTQPLLDIRDNSTAAGGGWAMRFFGKDSLGNLQQGATVNGGLSTNTAGAYKGAIDFVVYGAGASVLAHAGFTGDGTHAGFIPVTDNSIYLGRPGQRWAGLYANAITAQSAVLNATAATAPPAAPSGTVLQATAADTFATIALSDGFAAAPSFGLRRANTSRTAPSQVLANQSLGEMTWRGYGATAYSGVQAWIQATASENWTDTAQGTNLFFATTAPGTASLVTRARLNSGGLALFGTTSGVATITPQAAAGTPTLTLPNASGTVAVSASAPLVLNATTGNLTITQKQAIMGSTGATTISAGSTNFITPSLISAAESNVYLPFPFAGTIKNLFVYSQGAPGAGESYIITFRNALADTTLTCTISGAASNSCNDQVNTVSVAASNRWSVKVVASAAAAATNISFSIQYDH